MKVLRKTLLLTFIMLSMISAHAGSRNFLTKVSGPLAFGPFQLSPPVGYWYSPASFQDVAGDSHRFNVAFFKTKEQAELIGQAAPKTDWDVVFSFSATYNEFKDIVSYYEALDRRYRSEDISDKLFYRELLGQTRAIFKDLPDWSCRESVSKGYPAEIGIECVRLSQYIVEITAIGFDENKVRANAKILKGMMNSLQENKGR